MKRFVELFRALDGTTATNAKVAALKAYFKDAEPRDAAWAVYFLTGQRLKRLVNTRELREWTADKAGLPLWLVEESYEHVGDLAETMTLLTPEPESSEAELPPLHRLVEDVVRPLGKLDDEARREAVVRQWDALPETARFLFNKLITGALRVGVSKRLVTRALAEVAGVEPGLVAHRLMGRWQPTEERFSALVAAEDADDPDPATPYPFFLAAPGRALPLVQRRGPARRALSRDRVGGRGAARRHGARRRDHGLERCRRPTAAVLGAADPDRAQEAGAEDAGKSAVRAAGLRSARSRRSGPARAAVERTPRMHAGAGRIGRCRHPLLESGRFRRLEGAARTARVQPGARRRGADAQACRIAVSGRAQARRLVEVEDRTLHLRRRAAVRPAWPWSAIEPVHRLHVRGARTGRPGAGGQGLFGADPEGDRRAGPLDSPEHEGTLRAGSVR